MVRVRSLQKDLNELRRRQLLSPDPALTPAPPRSISSSSISSGVSRSCASSSRTSEGGVHHRATEEGKEAGGVSHETPAHRSSSQHSADAASGEDEPQPPAAASSSAVSSSSEASERDVEATAQTAKTMRRGGSGSGWDSLASPSSTGSRFDVLTRTSVDGSPCCRRSDLRRARKLCQEKSVRNNNSVVGGGGTAAATATGAGKATEEEGEGEAEGALPTDGTGATAGGEAASADPAMAALLAGTPIAIPSPAPFRRLLAQPFAFILVCDFEATCESGSVQYPHEIIEFPVVVLETRSLKVVAEFHSYVRPVRNPTLTRFCTELTGITQSMTDASDPLPVVVERFDNWLHEVIYPMCQAWKQRYGEDKLSTNLRSEQKRFVLDDRTERARAAAEWEKMICFATDGPWDMRRFMHECGVLRDGIDFPPVCYRYINVRHCYSEFFKTRQIKLTHMLKRLSMGFEGQRHSGIADTRNIARVLAELFARGYRVHHVSTIKYAHRGDAFLEGNIAAQELLAEYGEEVEKHDSRQNPRGQQTKKGGGGGGGRQQQTRRTQKNRRRK